MIKLSSASVTYKDKVILSAINLEIKSGQKIALVGSSGSGKSSLLKFLQQTLKNKNISSTLIPQEYGLVQNLSVFHNVYMGNLNNHSTIYNLINLIKPLATPVAEVKAILQTVQLSEKIFEPVAQLSGGQQQRTSIARALMHASNILLADEPISSLDETQSKQIMSLLCNKFESIIFSLHDVDLALEFCDRIIGLSNGKIVIDSPSKNLTRLELLQLYSD